jgi:hypothetical protein
VPEGAGRRREAPGGVRRRQEGARSMLMRASTILATGRATHLFPEAPEGPYQCS